MTVTASPAGGARLTTLSRSVAGSVALVTGAASGMGRATAHLLADEGVRVGVVDLDEARVGDVVAEITDVHGPDAALGVVADLGGVGACGDAVEQVTAWGGRLDILVNNAGISLVDGARVDEEDFEASWERTMAVNLTSQARLVRHALPHLEAAPAGRVVNIASTEAIVATASLAAYAASKAGVTGLTRSLAVEIGRDGLTVNCICPGPIETAMTERFPGEAKATYARRRVPMRRYGSAEEVAQMTLNLCLPASSYVNGAVIPVDGGMTVRHT
ncbi:MAG: 3-oxoacyl-ACP reductase [Nocardioides sp.]|nr:3-oxoacyl-ACP reductase [Nocardioides sp.]